MEKTYNIQEREVDLQKFWKDKRVNEYDPSREWDIYSIDTPPPTVSWKIHIWHIFSYTQAEVIARYKRMLWNILFYPLWFDDNWLPTERLVEKEIWKKWSELTREDFNNECLKITEEYRFKFKELWKSMWFWIDWNLSYSTISPEVQKVSQKSFLELLRKWVIYSKESPTLWCTECKTAIAQAELEKKEKSTIFYDIEFNLENWAPIIISTTRPELLPSCLAVFVNSKDKKYKTIVWKSVITPLWEKIKIIADDKVDQLKGTWVVMCCSYWDETDMYWIKKYWLKEKIILDDWWKMKDTWIPEIDWVYYKKARKEIIALLKVNNKVINEKNIQHDVWVHERCWTPIDILTVKQWFIKTIDIKDKLIELWNEINWNPSYMKKRYVEWVGNLKWDWCISRQRYFWVPIPLWYSKKTGNIILPEESELPINPIKNKPKKIPENHSDEDIIPEMDVLDTWATSSLTPLINSGFFDEKWEKKWLLPMDLRPQAHDIIRTWTLYTIIMSYYHTWDIPFKNIMISGHVLAPKWEKISKSKNNAWKSPEELIDTYWADPIRYWACWWSLWKDIVFDEKEIEKWRKLVTKLWNATRYAILNLDGFNPKQNKLLKLTNIDEWIIGKMNVVSNKMKEAFESFNVWHALIEFENFFWSDFCDNYIEIVKDKIVNSQNYVNWENWKISSQHWLYVSLLNIIKLIAPILPHISEEIYQNYFKDFEWKESIHQFKYPVSYNNDNDFNSKNIEVSKLFEYITLIRKFKTENWIKYSQENKETIVYWTRLDILILSKYEDDIKSISRSKKVAFVESESSFVEIKN